MNYRQAQIFLITTIIIAVLLIVGLIVKPFFTSADDEPQDDTQTVHTEQKISLPTDTTSNDIVKLHIDQRVGNLRKQLSDLNPAHLEYAQRIGIKPIESTRDILRLKRPIVHVQSNDLHKLDKLTHSYPYLVPQAAALLDTIGARFNQKLAKQGGGDYTIIVTSLLRTQESVKRLQRRNVNSTQNSAHLYGTTFDISYINFHEGMFNTAKHTDGQLKNLLAEVLLELKEEGKCLVKFEHKQSCFHITATGN